MFRLTSSHLQARGPQDVDPSKAKFSAFWDPQRLQLKTYTLYINVKYKCLCYIVT